MSYALQRRRKRLYKQNLAGVRDEYIDVGAGIASLLFFAAGARRLAGVVSIAEGAWLISRHKQVSGWAGLIIGSTFLLFPSWPERLFKSDTTEKTDKST